MSRFVWRQWLLVIPIIAVVLFFNNNQTEQLPVPEQQSSEQHESDYYLRQVHITHMGSDGAVADELFSELLTHYPHDDHSDLIAPRFRLHRPNGEQVWAESKQGIIYGEEKIVLKQEVNIEQRSIDNRTTSRIEGSEIEIERTTKKMTSREHVTITGENYTIVAGAMELLSNEKILHLSRGVKGHYEP